MSDVAIERDEEGYVVFRVPVDDATVAWLCELAEQHHHEPALIAAAILRDVRADDQREHDLVAAPPPERPSGAALN